VAVEQQDGTFAVLNPGNYVGTRERRGRLILGQGMRRGILKLGRQTLCLSGEDFRRFLEAQPHLKSAIMETITRRLRERLEHA